MYVIMVSAQQGVKPEDHTVIDEPVCEICVLKESFK